MQKDAIKPTKKHRFNLSPNLVREKQMRQFVQSLYPIAFNHNNPPPLKIGIHRDLMERHPNLDEEEVRNFFFFWTFLRKEYPRRDQESPRVDLDGNAAPSLQEVLSESTAE